MFDINEFVDRQLAAWHEARNRHEALARVETRRIDLADGTRYEVIFNPSRITSTAARVDAASIAARRCFLCRENRPSEQMAINADGYEILVNPFPIFPRHLTIAAIDHTPQIIAGRVGDMARLATELPGFTLFYNGAKCGASAPDHFHFQAVPNRYLPLRERYPFKVLRFRATTSDAESAFSETISQLPIHSDEAEPRINVLCTAISDDMIEFVIIPRRAHRPANYGDGNGEVLLSPASVDLGGTIVTPRRKEFDSLDATSLSEIFTQLCYQSATIAVGVLMAPHVEITFQHGFDISGKHKFIVSDTPAIFRANAPDSRFTVHNVRIGIGFHWDQTLDQTFTGDCRLVADGENVVVINDVDIEDYLKSVISSEMSSEAYPPLLRAHAIISRSWALAQIMHKSHGAKPSTAEITIGETVKWYDHDDHSLYDVCADDHCQRYQGVSRICNKAAIDAIEATRGMVLVDADGQLCDARFSKCCGGIMEEFSACWEPKDYSYLKAVSDTDPSSEADVSDEKLAHQWIMSRPEAFCNCADSSILSKVLNDFDLATKDFYRWKVEYGIDELSRLVAQRSGIDFGTITDLIPITRGRSGRITRLKIVGSRCTHVVGKELEIRRWLSPTHLYSSAFVVEKTASHFVLHGAGWGHGVGLCQIGAAVMASRGYSHEAILSHYYPGASIRPMQQ